MLKPILIPQSRLRVETTKNFRGILHTHLEVEIQPSWLKQGYHNRNSTFPKEQVVHH